MLLLSTLSCRTIALACSLARSLIQVIHKFNNDEARQLKLQGELPDNIKINEGEVTVGEADDGEGVEFADMSDSDEEGASGNRVSQQNRRLDLVSDDEKSDLDIDDI